MKLAIRTFQFTPLVSAVCLLCSFSSSSGADGGPTKSVHDSVKTAGLVLSPIVDYDAYLKLAANVQSYRKNRLISLDSFMRWGNDSGVVILDTRSDSLYNAKHIKGAIHLNFSDFTQEALNKLIPNPNTKILIYCNNNFKDFNFETEEAVEPRYLVSKVARPIRPVAAKLEAKPTSLALNIPTFINLVGYGFSNIYELGEQVFVFDPRLKFEGTAVTTGKN